MYSRADLSDPYATGLLDHFMRILTAIPACLTLELAALEDAVAEPFQTDIA